MDIRCRKLGCKFNDRFTCTAKDITIGREVACLKYEKGENKKDETDETKFMFEKTPDFAPQRDAKTIKIDCMAKCLFNHGGRCVSNGITLNSVKEKPLCVSFLHK